MSNTSKFFQEKKRWSTYKDKLLENYLPLYLSKILATKKDTLFIDGFAGKGFFDDGTIGSPIIIRDKVEKAIQQSRYHTKIIPIFIEYNKKYAQSLSKSLDRKWCYVRNADYKKEALAIISRNKHRNIFLYVDPFGIKHIQYEIFCELAKNPNSVELLLNLNSFGFIREGCRLLGVEIDDELEAFKETEESDTFVNDIENMNRIANGEYWQDIIELIKDGGITAKQAEEMFVHYYMEKLGQDFDYIFQFAIKTGDKNIPKYRMIFATNHIQGALYMSENMIKCNNEMNLDNHGRQESLFDYEFTRNSCVDDVLEVLTKASESEKIIDCKDLCMLTYMTLGPKYLHSDIKKALTELEKSSKIKITRRNEFTPTGKLSRSMDFINNEIFVELL